MENDVLHKRCVVGTLWKMALIWIACDMSNEEGQNIRRVRRLSSIFVHHMERLTHEADSPLRLSADFYFFILLTGCTQHFRRVVAAKELCGIPVRDFTDNTTSLRAGLLSVRSIRERQRISDITPDDRGLGNDEFDGRSRQTSLSIAPVNTIVFTRSVSWYEEQPERLQHQPQLMSTRSRVLKIIRRCCRYDEVDGRKGIATVTPLV